MNKKQRLMGLDLFRGIAVFSVVILHSDGMVLVRPPTWEVVRQFALFAVPFFLATSFYLAIKKLYRSGDKYPLSLRLTRLIIPYLFWSAVYLIYKTTKYFINSEPDKLVSLFKDPVSIVFFGGAAFHLYFLPLLISGTLFIKFAEYLISKEVKLKFLVLSCILSFFIYELTLVSGNSFEVGSYTAFKPLLDSAFLTGSNNLLVRLILVGLSWILRCLPYILTAMILSHPFFKPGLIKSKVSNSIILFVIFLVLNLFGEAFILESFYEVSRGYVAFFLAISISDYIKENSLIKNLGLCSFGIYLIHLFVVEVLQIIGNKLYPEHMTQASTGILLTISVISFFISWSITSVLVHKKLIAKLKLI